MKGMGKGNWRRRDLALWEEACRRLTMARTALRDIAKGVKQGDALGTASADRRYWKREEVKANERVAGLERSIVRAAWQEVFNGGRQLNPIRPRFARARRK